MNKPLDLPDVTVSTVTVYGSGTAGGTSAIQITHKKTGMVTILAPERLNAWLLRQLRQELVSTKEKP